MTDIRFVLSEYKGGILSYSINMQTNRLETVGFYHAGSCFAALDTSINIGDIFVAKVINIVPNIQAAFIDYQKGQRGFLPINGYQPVLTNRNFDGQIKAGDELLVQLEKEAVRSKDPVFTMNLSIPGKYSVVTNANRIKGVSKKCQKTVREKLAECIPDDIDYGIIIRTNAAELFLDSAKNAEFPEKVIEAECRQLCAQMDNLLKNGVHRTCYSRVWQSPPPYITTLRDMRNINYSRIVTDNPKLQEQLIAFADMYAPELKEKITFYTDTYSLHKLHSIETKLNELFQPKVWLKSGAYLVIEKTEAMYVIDVNSGKNIAKKANAAYILSINLEAAKEIMYQIRLRNLTGIIVVDFINMDNGDSKEQLLQALRQYAKQDMVLTTIIDMTALELVEITRQKNYKSLMEQFREISE